MYRTWFGFLLTRLITLARILGIVTKYFREDGSFAVTAESSRSIKLVIRGCSPCPLEPTTYLRLRRQNVNLRLSILCMADRLRTCWQSIFVSPCDSNRRFSVRTEWHYDRWLQRVASCKHERKELRNRRCLVSDNPVGVLAFNSPAYHDERSTTPFYWFPWDSFSQLVQLRVIDESYTRALSNID